MQLNSRPVTDVQIAGVDSRDYPDFCDAYFESACYLDGTPLTDAELEQLQNQYPEVVSELAYDSLH